MSVRARKTAAWRKFPHPDDMFDYAGPKLKAHWRRLHRGDREPYPETRELQQAWRLFHAGEFERAASMGAELGGAGDCVASRATAIYANYLEPDEARKLALFDAAAKAAQRAAEALPAHANAHYLRAYALGRYSQGISVLVALSRGLGGTVKACLEQALKLDPAHADAHTALGTYHAEIIDKVGALVGGLTYGANRDEGLAHYLKALALNPGSAIARIEYANGLLLLFGKTRGAEAEKLYREAAAIEPADAMERLDVELAASALA